MIGNGVAAETQAEVGDIAVHRCLHPGELQVQPRGLQRGLGGAQLGIVFARRSEVRLGAGQLCILQSKCADPVSVLCQIAALTLQDDEDRCGPKVLSIARTARLQDFAFPLVPPEKLSLRWQVLVASQLGIVVFKRTSFPDSTNGTRCAYSSIATT